MEASRLATQVLRAKTIHDRVEARLAELRRGDKASEFENKKTAEFALAKNALDIAATKPLSALTNPQATAVLRSCGKEGKGNKPELQAALATLLRELTPSVGSSDAGLDAARELVSAAEAQHRLLTAPQAPPPELTPAPEAAPAPPERPRRHARAT